MRLHDDMYVLPIAREGQPAPLNLSLILDPAAGPALVDTGMPGMLPLIAAALGEAGVEVGQLTRPLGLALLTLLGEMAGVADVAPPCSDHIGCWQVP